MKESNWERKQVDVGGVDERWKEDRSASPPKQSYGEQENLNLKEMKTKVPTSVRYQKHPGKERKGKLIAPRVRIEKSLSVIGLPVLPPSLEEEEHAGTCAQTAMSSRSIQ